MVFFVELWQNLPMIHFKNLSRFPELEHGMTEISDVVPDGLVQGEQLHKTGVAWAVVTSPRLPDLVPGVDALATRESGVGISVRVADCVPIFLYDSQKKILAVIHAGWRGTALGIARKSVEWLRKEAQISVQKTFVGIGPAIGPQDFIVGAEVARQFSRSVVTELPEDESGEQKYTVDLWQANVEQLVDAGVLLKNIEVVKRSTFSDDKLYSARRGDKLERNIAWMKFK